MKFTTTRDKLLAPLQQVVGVIERRQTLPILSNVLLKLQDGGLEFTGTDLEVQLVTQSAVDDGEDGQITAPARKLLDICRLLPEGGVVKADLREDKLALQCGRGRYSLATLPAEHYPAFDAGSPELEVSLSSRVLKKAMEKTVFAMAQQDVRYYLNGLLLELNGPLVRAVASDGHRLALYQETVESLDAAPRQAIVPRKGVLELYRLLGDQDEIVTLQLSANTIRVFLPTVAFSSKLIEGRFPDFQRVMPRDISKVVTVERDAFKAALTRVQVLSSDKIRGVSLEADNQLMKLTAQNPEHEEAEEELEIRLEGEGLSVGFNAAYLLDAVNNIDSGELRLSFTDAANSCLIEDTANDRFKFIVMPMRL